MGWLYQTNSILNSAGLGKVRKKVSARYKCLIFRHRRWDLKGIKQVKKQKRPAITFVHASLFNFNGGVFGIHCTENFPQIQVVDKITLEAKKPTIDEIFLKQKYVIEGLSSNEIAKLTFSSRPKITRLLKQYKIPLKTVTRRNKGGHVYGYRRFGGKAIEMKKEQEVIGLIKSYREIGYSYQKIADILNQKKIETKTRKGFWYSKVVMGIYKSNI